MIEAFEASPGVVRPESKSCSLTLEIELSAGLVDVVKLESDADSKSQFRFDGTETLRLEANKGVDRTTKECVVDSESPVDSSEKLSNHFTVIQWLTRDSN